MALSVNQIQIIDITEKVGSIFSVIGEAFVILTFVFSCKFRKPINRLVFYATWGNIFANVATLIGRNGISTGLGSPLCQIQSFLIQWFMPADALWTLAMACNVWLSFFYHYDAPKLRSFEWKYLLLCYGLPLLPALTFLFLSTNRMGKVYGDAVLWCWVSLDWDFLRVAVFYAPVWIVILLTIAVYIRVGVVIYTWRNQLVSFGRCSEQGQQRAIQLVNTPIRGIRRTDEVVITREVTLDSVPYTQFRDPLPPTPIPIDSGRGLGSCLRDRAIFVGQYCQARGSRGTFRAAGYQTNKATIKYYKCALLFFIALLVTWVPSTVNRIYTLVFPDNVLFGLQFAAALVLPLQGFWNAVVYVATSVYACKCLWQEVLFTLHICEVAPEPSPLRRQVRSLSLGSRRGWPAESDTYSLKSPRTD